MFKINQEKVEEMKKNAEKIIKENSHMICYGIGVGVGAIAGAVLVGSKAKSKGFDLGYKEALKLLNETRDGIVDVLIDHDTERNCVLLQLTKHSLAGDFTVKSAMPADMARQISDVLKEASDIVNPVEVVTF